MRTLTRQKRTRLRRDGKVGPTRGWKGFAAAGARGFVNPRAPSVPATLDLTLKEYFAATSLMGLLASMTDEPDQAWACSWAFRMGEKMAAESKRRRRKRS